MSDLNACSTRACPVCGLPQTTLAVSWREGTRYIWRPCECRESAIDASEVRRASWRAALNQAYTQPNLVDDLDALAVQGLTLATFRPELLEPGPTGEHPLTVATEWLTSITDQDRAIHTDEAMPPSMLYLTSPTRGCGKTHIATGLALAARETGRSAAFVEEKRLLAAYWGASLEAQERLLIRYGERIWLLVIDDLGRRPVRRQHEDETTSVADVWDALLNRRYARGGWTVITSNRTPTELLDTGTINLSTFSRIGQMTRLRVIRVRGEDQRLSTRKGQ